MRKRYAATQVCEITLERNEVEKIVADNLITRGGDPSYDFATAHPIFVWDQKWGGCSVRFVQQAVVGKEPDSFIQLKPVATSEELRKIMDERLKKANVA